MTHHLLWQLSKDDMPSQKYENKRCSRQLVGCCRNFLATFGGWKIRQEGSWHLTLIFTLFFKKKKSSETPCKPLWLLFKPQNNLKALQNSRIKTDLKILFEYGSNLFGTIDGKNHHHWTLISKRNPLISSFAFLESEMWMNKHFRLTCYFPSTFLSPLSTLRIENEQNWVFKN
jgi:hypothetical protein